MRFPRMRFSVRHLMVAVAIVALCLGFVSWMKQRSARLYAIGLFHRDQIVAILAGAPDANGKFHYSPMDIDQKLRRVSERQRRKDIWREEMAQKYWRASEQPWLPVAADTPEPE